jgi:hypothetical protein
MSVPNLDYPPVRDEIIAEVRAVREELAAEYGYELDRLYDAAKKWEEESDQPKVEADPKRCFTAGDT